MGRLEVICGSMFAEKTEELIRRLHLANIAGYKTMMFKPKRDNRYADEEVVTHNGKSVPAVSVTGAGRIPELIGEAEVVGIDEVQFFGDDVVAIVEALADAGTRVVVAGLDTDFTATPFGPMPALMCVADQVTKQRAVCDDCGAYGPCRTFRLGDGADQVELGGKGQYLPLCRRCFHARRSE